MMHENDGSLRSFLDGEMSDRDRIRIETHLTACAACAGSLDRLRSEKVAVGAAMHVLDPASGEEAPAAGAVRGRIERRMPRATRVPGSRDPQRLLTRMPWPAWAAAAAAAGVLACWAFPPLRAVALDFIELFRVERVQVAQIDPGDLPDRLQASAQLSRVLSDQVRVEPDGVSREVASSAEASSLAGFTVRLPAALGVPSRLTVEPGARVNVRLDLPRMRELLREIGRADIALPEEFDGAEVDLAIAPCVRAEFGDGDRTSVLVQIPSPEVSAPAGFPVERMGEAILQILGMTADEAARFSRSVDWSTTLVVPLPRYGNDYEEVPVDGVTGTLIRHHGGHEDAHLLLWVRDGRVYALSGTDSPPAIEMSAEPRVAERLPAAGVALSAEPNPSRDTVTLRYALPAEAAGAPAAIAIYDVSGRRVMRLELPQAAGESTVRWNGADERGAPAAPGLYYARLTAGQVVATTRISRVR